MFRPAFVWVAFAVVGAGYAPGLSAAVEPVTALVYQPSGKAVAVGQGGSVRFFDADGRALGAVDHLPGRVTALAFASTGRLLAVASGEPGKSGVLDLFAVAANGKPGERLLSIPKAHADSIYGLAFSPDGKRLASAGYDRLIHLWNAPASDAKGEPRSLETPLRTLKDHSDTVYALAFHPAGKLLASVAADRAVKVWDADTGTRLYTLSEPTDWLYTVAWSPDGQHLAAGGVDRSLRIWKADATGGKLLRSAFAHEKAVLRLAFTADGTTLVSAGEDRVIKAWDAATLKETAVLPAQADSILAFTLRPDGRQIAVGRHDGVAELLDAATGKPQVPLLPQVAKPAADRFPIVPEASAATDSARKAMPITLPATIVGTLDRAGDVDFFRFAATPGQQIGVQVVLAPAAAKLDPVLVLTDEAGRTLAEGTRTLGYTVSRAGTLALGLRDREFNGGPEFQYRLRVGPIPVVTGVFPLGATRGRTTAIRLNGVNLGDAANTSLVVPADARPGSRIDVPLAANPEGETRLGTPSVVVGEFLSFVVGEAGRVELPAIPGTADGAFSKPHEAHVVRFPAKKGQRLVLEVNANRLGSPVDSVLEILDAVGKPVPLAVLRSTAKTFTTLRDHDAEKPGIRLETWNDLAINDLLYANGELMRILDLPRGPDDDCQFYQHAGKRLGFLGTTPTFHPFAGTLYRVERHPPGSTFAPNGMPVFTLAHRNDDGGRGFGSDSRLVFDPPADGTFQARITDSRGASGPGHAYRLTIREPRPDFRVVFTPEAPRLAKGDAVPVTATATRFDDFDGPIEVRFEGLPSGVHAPGTRIEGPFSTTVFPLAVDADAVLPVNGVPLKLIARATIAGREVVKETPGKELKLLEPGDILTTVPQREIVIRPGQEARFTVAIERRNGFNGRVPVTVLGLPHGVRVLNVGLNGILITERDTSREVVLFAEPWVQPAERPLAIVAKREGKNTDHGAKPVILRVEK